MTDEMNARADQLAEAMQADEAEDAADTNQKVLHSTGNI